MPDTDHLRPPPRACGAKTRSGGACRQLAMLGGARCRMHGGSAPQVLAKAAKRLDAWRREEAGFVETLRRAELRERFEAIKKGKPERLTARELVDLTRLEDHLRGGADKVELGGGATPVRVVLHPSLAPKKDAAKAEP